MDHQSSTNRLMTNFRSSFVGGSEVCNQGSTKLVDLYQPRDPRWMDVERELSITIRIGIVYRPTQRDTICRLDVSWNALHTLPRVH